MKQIKLIDLAIKNFRSFKNEAISFPDNSSLNLISGENITLPELGANGAGKSSLWEALVWCLYGSGIKNTKTSAFISWGETQAEVTATLELNKNTYVITRSGPPTKVFVDGKPVEQKHIDEFLGLSKLRFLHSAVFGQGVKLFPDLTIPERSELLDQILDLQIWQTATERATTSHTYWSENIANLESQITTMEVFLKDAELDQEQQVHKINEWDTWNAQRISTSQNAFLQWEEDKEFNIKVITDRVRVWDEEQASLIQTVEQKKADFIKNKERLIIAFKNEINLHKLGIDLALKGKKDNQEISAEEHKKYEAYTEERSKTLSEFWEIRSNLRLVVATLQEASLTDFKETTCSTCKQVITHAFKIQYLEQCRNEREELENLYNTYNTKIAELDIMLSQISATKETLFRKFVQYENNENHLTKCINSAQLELAKCESATDVINEYEAEIGKLQKQVNPLLHIRKDLIASVNPETGRLEELKKQENPHLTGLTYIQQKKQELRESIATTQSAVQAQQKLVDIADYWKSAFKRIRLYYTNRVLKVLQVEIQAAIVGLGLQGWKIELATESETKSGTTKLGIAIKVFSPEAEGSWETWSGGETQRLRLAIAMGVASLIQRFAGVNFEFEVWDEPTNWLSAEGIENLLEVLNYRSESKQKPIWIIDHRALTYSGFKEVWIVKKDTDGSRIHKVSKGEV